MLTLVRQMIVFTTVLTIDEHSFVLWPSGIGIRWRSALRLDVSFSLRPSPVPERSLERCVLVSDRCGFFIETRHACRNMPCLCSQVSDMCCLQPTRAFAATTTVALLDEAMTSGVVPLWPWFWRTLRSIETSHVFTVWSPWHQLQRMCQFVGSLDGQIQFIVVKSNIYITVTQEENISGFQYTSVRITVPTLPGWHLAQQCC